MTVLEELYYCNDVRKISERALRGEGTCDREREYPRVYKALLQKNKTNTQINNDKRKKKHFNPDDAV